MKQLPKKRLAAVALCSCLSFMTMGSLQAYAETDSTDMALDHLSVALSADKDEYDINEQIYLNLDIENPHSYAINDLSVNMDLPNHLILKSLEVPDNKTMLNAGEHITAHAVVAVQADGEEGTSIQSTTTTNATTTNSATGTTTISSATTAAATTAISTTQVKSDGNVKTGDEGVYGTVIVLLVAFSVAFFTTKKKKGANRLFSILLCALILANYLPASEIKANAVDIPKVVDDSIKSQTTITADNVSYDISAIVSYSFSFKDAVDEYEIDTDSDGIPDIMEKQLGLNPNKDDTDDDKLNDYFEYVNAVTNPRIADTDGNGVSDFEEDSDEDGLKNGDEQASNSYAFDKDSDDDGLTDGDEVHKYSTDPTNQDTDGDGLTDYEEVKLGLDPLKISSDGSVNDSEKKIPQTASDATKDTALIESDNWLVPQLSGNVAGLLDNQVFMRKDESMSFNDNHSILSDVIEIDSSCSSALNLEFSFKENYTGNPEQLVIAYYDNEAHELHLVDSHLSDAQNKLEGEINSSGYYFVMDIDEFLKSIGIDVINNISDISEGVSTESYLAPLMFAPRAMASPAEVSIGKADIVFVVDTTGSMSDAIYNVQDNINTFADKISNEYHVDMNYSLIEYRDIEEDGVDSTIAHTNLSSRWFTNVNTFKSEVSKLTVDGGGDIPETPIDALELARKSNWRNGATKFVVLVTDVPSKDDNTSGIENMDEMAQKFAADGIVVSVITDYRADYANLLDQTHGLYGDIYSDFSNILLQLAGIIGTETHEGGDWIILDDYSIVQLKGSIDDIGVLDSDEDGLKDSDELIGKTTVDVKPLVMAALALHGVPMDRYIGKTEIEVWKFISNPTLPDTDFDGLDDTLDKEPRNPKVHSFVIYETRDDEAGLQKQKTYNGNDSRRAEDFQYADKTHDQLCDMDYIWWGDVMFPDSKLYMLHMREFPPLASASDTAMIGVGQDMISHFADGSGSDYRNSTLTNRVENHDNTKKYANAVEAVFKEVLKENNGNLGRLMYYNTDGMRDEYSVMVKKMSQEIDAGNKDLFQPSYQDKFNGLGITVDGLYGNRIEVTSYSLNGNHYTANLHYVMYDVYGLDSTDITDEYISGFHFGLIDCFRAWYILQHWDTFDGDYKPFVTFMEFDRVVEGDI
ncbi:DUF3289 family protein [Ruminococcus sp. XPD3002]|uniref:DUF3289 family protein n=1 Tax=Ruminococcus sp. XPD3002 TaxID=1452269 RepID=UPI00091D4332|nr:conserved hypothetical protein [Ruminococcus flavefaciens]